MLASGSRALAQGQAYYANGGSYDCESIGDLDGDGRPEFAVGYAPLVGLQSVRIHRAIDGSVLRTHSVATNTFQYGQTVAKLGDVDADGIGDYAIGAPATNTQSGAFVEFRSGASGALLRTLNGPNLTDMFGVALENAGDIDGDGVDDLWIGSRSFTPGIPSAVHRVSGRTGALLATIAAGPNASPYFGDALARMGDIDGDGQADLAVGDPKDLSDLYGRVDVYSGASGALLYDFAATTQNRLGASIAALSDVNGDGVGDLAVGAPAEFLAQFNAGRVEVRSGSNGALLYAVTAGYGIYFGDSVANLGDQNGDGVSDFASVVPTVFIGGVLKNRGYTHAFSGANGAQLWSTAHMYTGPLAPAGDVNLDGVEDLLVGGVDSTLVVLGDAPLALGYCDAQLSSVGCRSYPQVVGSASLTVGPELSLTAANLRPNRTGMFFWGLASAALPFGGGTMCVAAPRVRLPAGITIGDSGCSGILATPMPRAYLSAQGLVAGSVFYAQAWVRDAAGSSANNIQMSAGVAVTLWP